MHDLTPTLLAFSPIALEEMQDVLLLDRIDTKYVISQDQLDEYLKAIYDQYKILVVNGHFLHPYETLYFDTPGYYLFKMHNNGTQNRYKVRFRKYLNSGQAFFEIKTKSNAHRTIKKRLPVENIFETLNGPLNKFIADHTTGRLRNFVPVLRVYFNRITLVNKQGNERLTIDTDIRYSDNHHTEKNIENMVVIEVKQEKICFSPFQELLEQHEQHEHYLSKYCLGVNCMKKDASKSRPGEKVSVLKKLGYNIHDIS